MPPKSNTPYIAPEGVSSDTSTVLFEVPISAPAAQAPARDFDKEPLTDAEQQAQALSNLYLAYVALFGACKRLISRARPANKLKHNYFVCAADLEDVVINMDARIAGALNVGKQEDKA